MHSKSLGVRRAISAADCAECCVEAVAAFDESIEIWTYGKCRPNLRRIDLEVSTQDGLTLTEDERRPVTHADRALRIFTSGTTGLPKAAEVSHRKIVVWTHWFAGLAGLTATDRLYNCLPMHHSVGGVVAIGAPLVFGGSVAIAERFSARSFWDDVVRWECTACQYIGELFRYLLAGAESPRGEGTQVAARDWQWTLGWRMARSPGTLRTHKRARILRFDRRKCLALQCRRQGRINWTGAPLPRAP